MDLGLSALRQKYATVLWWVPLQMGMMFSPQYAQQFQQQWMTPENFQFQQMYQQ
eukprot:COSAG02_NODE_8328_length_2613_cov_6.560461_3_plen_53_part_01